MQVLYNMGTGRVIETTSEEQKQVKLPAQDTRHLPELKLQEINYSHCEERRIPPDLAIADLDAILKQMS